jgi:PAS domain S-box-containing protein
MSAKILVVDDNPTNLKLVSAVLEFEGHDILTAVDADEAQVVLAVTLPDLILMDIALPGMDGLTLTRKLKAEERTRGIPIVALTAFAMKGDDQKALDAGCDGYISKPIDTRKLPDQVAGFLARASSQSRGSCMKILGTEDHAVDLKLADLVLSTTNRDVSAVEAAEPAFAAIQEDPPQRILLDLPGMDGLALARKLKADPDTRDIHTVGVTCYPEQYPKAAALATECDTYLLKPIKPRDLSGQLTAVTEVGRGQPACEMKAPMNLLIVDDDPTSLKLLRVQLEAEGHAVFEAHDGMDALALLNRQRVDAVISDILMPRMDGYRLCHEIRMNMRLHDLPFILYTATFTSPGDEKLALNVGADKYLPKPASVEIIIAALHEVSATPHAAPQPKALEEVEVLKEYSEQLVSKLKKRNTELQEQTEVLRVSEARYTNIVNLAADAIISVDEKQRIVIFNQGAERIFGYTAAEMLGQPLDMLLPAHLAEAYCVHIRGFATESGPARDMNRCAEIHGRRRDGTEFPAEASISKVKENGEFRFTVFLRDVSAREQAEEEIRQLNINLERRVLERTDELQAANLELEAFSYSVSHDLRAPLRSIDGFSQALLEDYADQLDDQARDHLNRIHGATQRMGHLIDDMLTLSHVTRTEIHRESVDLSAFAADVLAEFQKSEPERKVDCRIESGLITAGDERLLRVLLINLLGNAWKFTGKTTNAKIEFGAMQNSTGAMEFFVRDNGAGFDVNYAGKLFGPFQRMHLLSEYPGTGIGLATVKRIVVRHGGRVWAEGQVGQGATFYFTLGERSACMKDNTILKSNK